MTLHGIQVVEELRRQIAKLSAVANVTHAR